MKRKVEHIRVGGDAIIWEFPKWTHLKATDGMHRSAPIGREYLPDR
jgi:hypothetical protein